VTSTNDQVLIEATRTLAPQIRSCSEEIERERRLPPSLVRALAEAGLFRLAVPQALGGGEADPLVLARVIEEVAKADGSVSWCVMIGAQAAWESAFLPEDAAQEIFSRDPCCRGWRRCPDGEGSLGG
jgi:indole-3-acetate monooxygenase